MRACLLAWLCWLAGVGECGGVGAATSSEKSPAAAGSSTAICSSPSWSDMLAAGALAPAAPWSRELPSVEPTCKAETSISADLGRVDRVAPRGIHVDGDVAHRRRVLWRRECGRGQHEKCAGARRVRAVCGTCDKTAGAHIEL